MGTDWIDCPVEQVAAPIKNALVGGPFGSNLVSKDYVDNGVPVIRGQNMGYGRWVTGLFVFVSSEKAKALSPNTARPGDIVFTQRGTVGQVAIVPDGPYEKYIVSQSQMKLTVDENKADKRFLYYLFSSASQQNYIKTNAIRVGVPHTNLGILKSTPLRLPPLDIQCNTSKLLGSLDDKIELNHRTNQIIEQISQAIFKSWFIDFEPVNAKEQIRKLGGDSVQIERAAQAIVSGTVNLEEIIAGSNLADLDNEIKNRLETKLGCQTKKQQCDLAETAKLFPDKLVKSELGMIPDGWKISCVEDEFNLIMGQSPPGDTYNENEIGMPFFQGRRDFGWRYPQKRVYCRHPKKMANIGDTLLSVRAPVGDINLAEIDCCIGRGLAAIRHKSNCGIFTYYSMMDLSRRLKMTYSDGTVFGSINQKVLKSIKIVAPPRSILENFSSNLKASEKQIQIFEMQSQTLESIRDALLPKLLSGEISIDTKESDLLKVV